MFQRLGGRAGSPAREGQFQVRPEMTPRKVERGRQPGRGSETSDRPAGRSQSGQKRRSASRAHNDVDSKKGKTDSRIGWDYGWQGTKGYGRNRLAEYRHRRPNPQVLPTSVFQAGLIRDFQVSTGSQNQVCRSSLRVLPKGPPKLRGHLDTIARRQHDLQRRRKKRSLPGSSRKTGSLLRRSLFGTKPTTGSLLRRIDWIPRVTLKKPDPFDSFGHQQVLYGLQIVAIIYWARKYLDLGMRHPLPTLPEYLFGSFVASRQTANSPLIRDESIYSPTDNIRKRFQQGWVLTAAVLQFWTDEQSILDGVVNGSRVRPMSVLAHYVMTQLNPVAPEDLQITWDQVVERTPWVGPTPGSH